MAMRHSIVLLFTIAVLVVFSSVNAAEIKKEESGNQVADDSRSTEDDSREKRSREEIMFGNQQNRPNGLVDDMMSMAENMADESKKSNTTQEEDKLADALKDEEDKSGEKGTPRHREEDNQSQNEVLMTTADNENWYNDSPVSDGALQYLVNTPTLRRLPPEDFSNSLYDQEDLYRRKRQLMGHPIPLRKRSLRSPLGQMIQTRGRRLPRRSMRLKRQVDVEDLLSLLGNLENERGRYYDDQMQLPSHFAYPESPSSDYRYPYGFMRQVEEPSTDDSSNSVDAENNSVDDIDNLMLMHPSPRYVEGPAEMPYRTREEENEAIQKWLARHATPSVFSVSRRASPAFYPVDYRYMVPGYKKRSRVMNSGGSRVDEQDPEFGKWGQIVRVPEAYASAEDVARLYALANLMSEGEEPEIKMRRSV